MKIVVGRTAMRLHESIPDFQRQFSGHTFVAALERDDILREAVDAHVLIGHPDRPVIAAAKQLKWVQAASTGVDAFMEIPELVNSDVILTNVRGTHGGPLSESVFGMIFYFTRELGNAALKQRERQWAMMELRPRMRELRGATMGIIGFGGVGRTLGRRAAAFDMRVIAVDKFPSNKPEFCEALWGMERLDDLLAQSDYVVMCAPYTKEAHHMISTRELALIKPTAMMIIISRGGLVDEAALMEALRANRLYAAAVDVFEDNVLKPESPWWDAPNTFVSPHIAGGSNLERDTILEIVTENLTKFLGGVRPLRNEIDKVKGF